MAAFFVFASHVATWVSPAVARVIAPVADQGRAGVAFFFVLSGFVLAWAVSDRDGSTAFYRSRFARIYPLYLTAWLLVALLDVLGRLPLGPERFIAGVLLLQDWVPDTSWYFAGNGVSWSLCCEALFYALFPLLVRWLRRLPSTGRRRVLLVAFALPFVLAAIAQAGHTGGNYFVVQNSFVMWVTNYLPLARLPEFVVGIVLALEARDGRWIDIGWYPALALSAVAYLAAGIWQSMFSPVAIVIVPFALLISAGAAADARGRRTLFSRRAAVWLGDRSFAFYLVHGTVVTLFAMFLSTDVWLLVPGALLIAVAFAAVLHSGIERPFNRWLRGAPNVLIDDATRATDAAPAMKAAA